MALTFSKFMIATVELPATILSGIVNYTFGYTERDKNGKVKTKNKKPIEHDGLLGLIMDAIKALGRGISTFVHNHKVAIATAFWASLFVAGGFALTLFLWPAALTFVATALAITTIANPLVQILIAASVVFATISALTYIVAAIVDIGIAIKHAIFPEPVESESEASSPDEPDGEHKNKNSHRTMMDNLHHDKDKKVSKEKHHGEHEQHEKEPTHSNPLHEKSNVASLDERRESKKASLGHDKHDVEHPHKHDDAEEATHSAGLS